MERKKFTNIDHAHTVADVGGLRQIFKYARDMLAVVRACEAVTQHIDNQRERIPLRAAEGQ